MAAARPTFEIDQEIIRLTRVKERLVCDLQDPISAGRRATLQQWLAAVQACLATLQAIVDGQRTVPGLSITRIQ